METLAGFTYSPKTDIPFGKQVRIGVQDSVIYQSVIEEAYHIGIEAHLQFMEDHDLTEPVVLDDKQFSMVIERLMPQELSSYDEGLWRSYFIVGWTCVSLGLVETQEEEE
ncbi:MAG TPA: hypothetical protein VHZ51_11590 [Ktedonobacteraceae bacterium]|nr:hypothetical protein [Ktedonobacteraceae bacterium]